MSRISSRPSVRLFAPLARPIVKGLVGLVAAAVPLVACDEQEGSSTKAGDPPTASAALICNYETFEVEVTNGPSKNLRLEGSLLLMAQPPSSALTGTLATADGTVPVTGHMYREGDIALTFHTEDGYVLGLGQVGDKFCKEGESLRGIALGPKVSPDDVLADTDTGHWFVGSPNRLLTFDTNIQLALDPIEGVVFSSNDPTAAGCTTTGNTTVCYSAVFPDASSGTGCSQSTATCIYDGRETPCSATRIPVNCPAS